MSNLTPIPQNYKKNVDWILKAYSDAGVSFPDGFQKDAIQNSVGARKTNKWKDFSCDISYVRNVHGNFIIIEDSGTVGLTGKNMSTDEVNAIMAKDEVLDKNERLARFTSMFNSGGNVQGGGLYGAGKSVYSVASKQYTYYFDSLREDGIYVANINKHGQVFSTAYENENAKFFIKKETGLEEKKSCGTRVIIVDPVDELVESINSGTIIPYIQESWWLILNRFHEDSSISLNGKRIDTPYNIKFGTHVYDLPAPEQYSTNHTVKHFGLYVFDKGDNQWQGVSYYRKGMKIGEIDLKDIPSKIDGKFWGYIEVDELWEDELAKIEDNVHFGVSRGKKTTSTYQFLKNYCNNKIAECFLKWGYIKNKENEDKKLRDELEKIAENIQGLFDKLGFEDLGVGPKKADFEVRWQNISYPETNSERVTSGDELKFTVRITSSYLVDKKFEYRIHIVNPKNGEIISNIHNEKITVKSSSVYQKDFTHVISTKNSLQFSENRIILSVKSIGSGKEKRKELPYFFDIDKPDNKREAVSLNLHECIFPREGSRRINYNEVLTNVCYRIENKRNHQLNYKLNISIHNANDPSNPKIIDVASIVGSINPFEEEITSSIKEILFDEDVFKKHLSEGILELRARLIANEDDEQFEKGDKITYYNFKLYLNCDEKNGKLNSFAIKGINAPDDYKRSWYTAGNERTIFINIGHTSYLNIIDYPEVEHEYLQEQMLKQFVMLYLAEGKYDMFSEPGKDFIILEPQEAAEQVIEKIEKIYSESLK